MLLVVCDLILATAQTSANIGYMERGKACRHVYGAWFDQKKNAEKKLELGLQFFEDGKVKLLPENSISDYTLRDSMLTLGSRKYIVVRLTKKDLVIRELNDSRIGSPFDQTLFFEKND